MDNEASNVSDKSLKNESNIRDSVESSMNHPEISVDSAVHSEVANMAALSEGGIMADEIKTDNEALQDSETEGSPGSSTSIDGSEDSGTSTDDADMVANLFSFASKEWLLDYSKRLPEILSKIAEPYLYRKDKCKFIRIQSSYPSFDPETVSLYIKAEEGKFQIKLDASLFVRRNISIQVIDDKINVAAYHQMEGPFGHEAHEMQQIFPLPECVDKDTITAELTLNGTLIIEAKLRGLKKPHVVQKSQSIIVQESKT